MFEFDFLNEIANSIEEKMKNTSIDDLKEIYEKKINESEKNNDR